MKRFFVTGTDTDVGKTVVSALLTRQLNAYYWKPIQSGTIETEDKNTVMQIADVNKDRILPCIYEFKAPLSPHEAAALEEVTVDPLRLAMPTVTGNLIIEGAGGVMVPINKTYLMIDLIKDLACETIVVARSGLGTINHTLLTLNALRHAGVKIKGVILNGPINHSNCQAIAEFGQANILGQLPFIENLDFRSLPVNYFNLEDEITEQPCSGE